MIRTTNIMTKDFTWSTEFNISTNKNEVLAMGPDKDFEYTFRPGLGTHPYSWLKVGQPVGVFYGYIMDGIYHSREQIDAGNEPTASLGQKYTGISMATVSYRLKTRPPSVTRTPTFSEVSTILSPTRISP